MVLYLFPGPFGFLFFAIIRSFPQREFFPSALPLRNEPQRPPFHFRVFLPSVPIGGARDPYIYAISFAHPRSWVRRPPLAPRGFCFFSFCAADLLHLPAPTPPPRLAKSPLIITHPHPTVVRRQRVALGGGTPFLLSSANPFFSPESCFGLLFSARLIVSFDPSGPLARLH